MIFCNVEVSILISGHRLLFPVCLLAVWLGLSEKFERLIIPLRLSMLTFSAGAAQGWEAPEGEYWAVHQLHPGGSDGTHQPRLLRGAWCFLQGAGRYEQEPAERWQQRESWRGKRDSPGHFSTLWFFILGPFV